ncbi:cell division protein DivIVA [Schaalia meyeri]|uniref:Cell wall synthesis protein Wag31 n=1 Tax=Schaalia meyeri TaxID=52773 RepID=A0AAP9Y888_9ACTO|nr:DivIVA domain-containing protein [Schaalia meyeri]AKU64724.1 cell division protein DivIVA [Schaalia meyeri]OFQ24435.1 cell division protein DivIVA [Actinomyces sp. HMSC062G12]QQC44609.1 DivIVA domain-containing protein [Schaalia meyeri]SDR64533.1 DivIVA domain-containing protein [Schaalia meyeri]
MALLTTEDVLNKKFQYVKFREGYDQDEVDEFLDEVVSTIYSLQVENQELKEKLEAAERRVAELSNSDFTPAETPAPAAAPAVEAPALMLNGPQDAESATSMLALAQRVHDEYVRDGEEQSAKIISEANAERDSIIADAQKQKESLLSQLDQERELLENKINGLRTFESEYRSNLRSHLESLLSEVGNNTN